MVVKRKERKIAVNAIHQIVINTRHRVWELFHESGLLKTTPQREERLNELKIAHKALLDELTDVRTTFQKKSRDLETKLAGKGIYAPTHDWKFYLTDKEAAKVRADIEKKLNVKMAELDRVENEALLLAVSDDGGMKAAVEKIQKQLAAILDT